MNRTLIDVLEPFSTCTCTSDEALLAFTLFHGILFWDALPEGRVKISCCEKSLKFLLGEVPMSLSRPETLMNPPSWIGHTAPWK